MPVGFFILIPLVVMLVALLAGHRLRRRYAGDWQARHRFAQIGLGLAMTVWMLFFISNLTSRQPFWPREALSLFFWTLFLGIMVYQWHYARRKAAEEPSPFPGRSKRKPPTFLWQAVLILLPVVIMTVTGFVALVRDRAAVENEARQRAEELIQQLQDNFGRRVASELSTIGMFSYQWLEHQRSSRGGWPGSEHQRTWEAYSTNYHSRLAEWQAKYPDTKPEDVFPNDLSFTADGRLDFATYAKAPPVPPAWLTELSVEQRATWDALKRDEAADADVSTITNRIAKFLETTPPAEAQANARFIRLRSKVRSLDPPEAIQQLRHFKWEDRQARSESGLPLNALVFAEILRYARHTGPTEESWRELNDQVYGPSSLLTPLLLDDMDSLVATNQVLRDGVAAWRVVWQGYERRSHIAEAIQQSGKLRGITTTNLWVEHDGVSWFCVLQPGEVQTHTSSNGVAVTFTNAVTRTEFFARRLMEHAFANALRDPKPLKQEYFGYAVELEGKPLTLPSRHRVLSAPSQSDLLAVGEFHMWQPGVMLLKHPQPGQQPMFGPEFETIPSHPKFILRVQLADRARLFATYHQRLSLFGGLILVSAVTAAVGVIMARRAFLREQQLSEMKSNFVSSVSHELRAPIASVRLMAESLERGKISGEQKQNEYFRFIVQECRRLTSLIENVLDFSRIEQGRKQYEFEPTDLVALTRETVKLMEPYAAERGVRLETLDLQPSTFNLELTVDGRAIQQALVNLIDNAIKHSPKEEVVTVGLDVGGQSSTDVALIDETRNTQPTPTINSQPSTINLSVTDHGEGIPPEEHEKIFERFYRLGTELRRETQGVGIGLSIVKHIVEAHGGRVRVESEVGKGSRFTIEIPVKRLETADGRR